MSVGKEYLIGRKVVFKIRGHEPYFGILQHYDSDGFWISSSDLMDDLNRDVKRGEALAKAAPEKPICYVPLTSVDYLIGSEDTSR
jgi:hypothetical protein